VIANLWPDLNRLTEFYRKIWSFCSNFWRKLNFSVWKIMPLTQVYTESAIAWNSLCEHTLQPASISTRQWWSTWVHSPRTRILGEVWNFSLPRPGVYPFTTPGAFPWCRHLLEIATQFPGITTWTLSTWSPVFVVLASTRLFHLLALRHREWPCMDLPGSDWAACVLA